MSEALRVLRACAVVVLTTAGVVAGDLLEKTTAYHHIRVVEKDGIRTLCFDNAEQSRMSIRQPLTGHFEYVDYFHMPWLWNDRITNVLMIGLGGGSVQRLWQAWHPSVNIDTAEIDPMVHQVARDYFQLRETDQFKVHIADGRQFLKRSTTRYDVVILDAYGRNRYGSYIPSHLVTKEFFELVRDHLTTNGVVAYNVIGSLQGVRSDLIGAMCRTMKSVFPHIYFFPAKESLNVVVIATRSNRPMTFALAQQSLAELANRRRGMPGSMATRIGAFRSAAPPAAATSPILTDDHAPVEGLLVEPSAADPFERIPAIRTPR